MSDWIAIHKGDAQFSIVEEMAAGIGSTVGLPGEHFRAWYHVHHGTFILIAGEAIKPEQWNVPAPDGVVRVQRRGTDGISTTLDVARGRPYWNKLSPQDHVGPTLDEVLDETAAAMSASLAL